MKDKFSEFYKIYCNQYDDSKYKYIAYRKAESEFKNRYGRRKYSSFDSFRVTLRKRLKKVSKSY